jgi:hypothetical protein
MCDFDVCSNVCRLSVKGKEQSIMIVLYPFPVMHLLFLLILSMVIFRVTVWEWDGGRLTRSLYLVAIRYLRRTL